MRLKIANSNTERYNFGVYKRTGDTKMSAYILNTSIPVLSKYRVVSNSWPLSRIVDLKTSWIKTGCLFILFYVRKLIL